MMSTNVLSIMSTNVLFIVLHHRVVLMPGNPRYHYPGTPKLLDPQKSITPQTEAEDEPHTLRGMGMPGGPSPGGWGVSLVRGPKLGNQASPGLNKILSHCNA